MNERVELPSGALIESDWRRVITEGICFGCGNTIGLSYHSKHSLLLSSEACCEWSVGVGKSASEVWFLCLWGREGLGVGEVFFKRGIMIGAGCLGFIAIGLLFLRLV